MPAVPVLIACAHRDDEARDELVRHLAAPSRLGLIQIWHEGLLPPGSDRKAQFSLHLQKARLIIVLISVDLLASNPIWDEVQRALALCDSGQVRVLPVLLRPTWLSGTALDGLALLPRDAPLSQLPSRDQGWCDVAAAVEASVRDLRAGLFTPAPAPAAEVPTLRQPEDPTAPGAVLGGKYRVLGEIGRGGMGRVLLARREDIGGQVAIKVLLPAFSTDADMAQRFFNEARAVNLVGHQALVQVFEHGQLRDGSTYLVMEHLRGEPLRALLGRGPAPSLAAPIGWQLAHALAAVHDRQIVHRDLKPDNIMLQPDPGSPGGVRCRILDFGIAKVAREGKGTRTGMQMGTPQYMAPEQCRDAGKVSDRADVYALGTILYEMLRGQPPFVGGDMYNLMYRQISEAPGRLKEQPDQPGLAALVHQMLAKAPASRPAMQEVAERLWPLLQPRKGAGLAPVDDKKGRPLLTGLLLGGAGAGGIAVAAVLLIGAGQGGKGGARTPGQDLSPAPQVRQVRLRTAPGKATIFRTGDEVHPLGDSGEDGLLVAVPLDRPLLLTIKKAAFQPAKITLGPQSPPEQLIKLEEE